MCLVLLRVQFRCTYSCLQLHKPRRCSMWAKPNCCTQSAQSGALDDGFSVLANLTSSFVPPHCLCFTELSSDVHLSDMAQLHRTSMIHLNSNIFATYRPSPLAGCALVVCTTVVYRHTSMHVAADERSWEWYLACSSYTLFNRYVADCNSELATRQG